MRSAIAAAAAVTALSLIPFREALADDFSTPILRLNGTTHTTQIWDGTAYRDVGIIDPATHLFAPANALPLTGGVTSIAVVDPLVGVITNAHEGATVAGLLQAGDTSATAKNITNYVFCNQVKCGQPDGIPVSRDAVRGVVKAVSGQAIDLLNGGGFYALNDAPNNIGSASPPYPSVVGVFAAAVSDVDNAFSWASNFVCGDGRYLVPQTGTGRLCYGNEIDMNFTSPSSQGGAMLIEGSSVVQPTNVGGITLGYLDLPNNGTTAKWSQFLYSFSGATGVFAHIGENTSVAGPSDGQTVQYGYRRADGTPEQMSAQMQRTGAMIWSPGDGALQNTIFGAVQVDTFPSATQETAVNAALFGTVGAANQPSQSIDLNVTNSLGGAQFARLQAIGGDIGLVKLISNAGPSWFETVSGFRVNGVSGATASGSTACVIKAVSGGIITSVTCT